MSSNIPLTPATEDTVKDVIGNLKTDQQEASHTKNEKPISNDSDKDMALDKLTSFDKSRSSSRTETEDTVKPQTKKDQFHKPVYMIKIPKNNNHKK